MKITYFSVSTEKIKNGDRFRIAHISDLHRKVFGTNNDFLAEQINKLSPDAVLMTGDMISRSSENLVPLENLITELSKNSPVYYSIGNHEQDAAVTNPKVYAELTEFIRKNCILLDNSSCLTENENYRLCISGITIPRECYKVNGRYRNLRWLTVGDVNNLLKVNCPHVNNPQTVNILMAHNPNFLDAYSEYGSDIILSGHVHGGCIRLPIAGGLLSPERRFFPKYCSGMYKKGKSSMIVSCGLGKFRLFNPPEICVIDIC